MNVETQIESEVNEKVDRLVSEIDRAIGLIEHLRRENAELKQQRQELQERVSRREDDLSTLSAERDRLQNIYKENASLIEKKGEIQNKIDAMLTRLDTLHIQSQPESET